MSEPIEYEITTIDDILKIPSDRVDIMFSELIPRIKQISEVKEQLKKIMPEGQSVDEAVKLGTMTWIDDGKTDVTTKITVIKKEGKK